MAGLSVRDPAVDRSLRSVFGEAAGAGPPPAKGRGQGRAGEGGFPPPSPSGPVPAALTGGIVSVSTVGNIPYEATEEQLKDIFSEVGPVVSFR